MPQQQGARGQPGSCTGGKGIDREEGAKSSKYKFPRLSPWSQQLSLGSARPGHPGEVGQRARNVFEEERGGADEGR